MNNKNIEMMLKNVKLAEKTHDIKMIPIYDIYMNSDPRMFMRHVYDYVWFDDYKICNVDFSLTGGYAWYIEKQKAKTKTIQL